ncbi:MAG TPA: AtpZ/AtpI family protein [Candidatus Saccharimonadales bacterium]|nr:AtpZ/AtpI family protein [Candidatus Saccharimonadales bacterium]
MNKAADHPTTKSVSGKAHLSLRTVALDLLDTAWRIAVPVVLFAGAGIFIDRKADSAPWFTLLGTVLGFVAAGYLLKQQLQAVQREDK